ncbi:phosphoglycerate dehydrogenase (plasmid) [Pedobacter sp. BS3]|uniref:NAD(P)-dependent oxidoreductase n=1 Tax=Pedobacter sp. BS3 TaxID=2567937 RepID=UPI0011F01B15|nr:NAD(P)-dependent oxidoreductase [Pedobacter sp. BS3]TZF86074.1 phosphoglycerate dehydrogenase [Pedobacter sp. BS3]
MDKPAILIVDDLHPIFKQRAGQLGYQVDDYPQFTLADTLANIGRYHGLVVRTKFRVDKQLMDAGEQLKFIARAGSGMDNVDEDYARSKNIQCINAPEGNRDAVGEHAIGMLLSLMNNLRKSDIEVRNGVWNREGNRGYELKGKTVGIIGYGNNGQSIARKLKGFDVTVLAYDKYRVNYGDEFARQAGMDEIFEQADILSLHIPLTAESRYLVTEDYLQRFRKPIFFVNTARGEIVNTQAILQAIKSGKIIAAALDVLETEKFPALKEQPWFNELAASNRVLLSPHIAGWTFDSYRKISEVLAEKLEQLGNGL